ncbi:MAG: DUF721 domain-containing protein [Nocardioides sp.]
MNSEDSGSPTEPAADGLDLAREAARAAAANRPKASRTQKRRRTEPGSGRPTGAHPDDRDPQLLSSTVGRVVGDHGWELELRVRSVIARWEEIVGAEVAEHTTAESFADGRLVVRADSTAWATQLTLLTSQLLVRINAELGPDTVTIVETLGPQAPTWKKGRLSVRGRGPRDTYG